MMHKRTTYHLILVLFIISFCGCSSSNVIRTTRLRGLDLDSTNVIAIGSIAGVRGPDFSEELATALKEKGKFSVSDKRIYDVPPNSINEETAKDIGRRTGASILITGIFDSKHAQGREWKELDVRDPISGNWSKQGKWYVEHTWSSEFRFTIRDLNTATVMLEYTMSSAKDFSMEEAAFQVGELLFPGLSEKNYYALIRKDILKEFIRELGTYTEDMNVNLLTDDSIPELKDGLSLAKDQQWDKAIEVFKDAINKHPNDVNIHKAYYDLGLAYEYSHMFEEARTYLEKAHQLKSEVDYGSEIRSCTIWEQEFRVQQKQAQKN